MGYLPSKDGDDYEIVASTDKFTRNFLIYRAIFLQ